MNENQRAKEPTPRSSTDPDDWSNPSAHPQMHVGIPIAAFSVLLLVVLAYGFFTG